MVDRDGAPLLIEANRSSHMLGEYLRFVRNELPFELVADVMNRAAGPACLLWRRCDPLPDADEDACFIGRHLSRHLRAPAAICNVEDNQEPRQELLSRDGRRIRPGSIFRWWYGLPWSYERSGATVINPNCLWVAVRDKWRSYQTLAVAESFRVPHAYVVESADEARRLIRQHPQSFSNGFVLKPRVGWGGFGVQVAEAGDEPRVVGPNYLLSERIVPPLANGRFWEARVFVMAGAYLGGVRHASLSPLTNYWQGARPEPLDAATTARLEAPALEAVKRLDAAADAIHRLPEPPRSPLTHVEY
ncbi:MAG: ATP-grasp domain-containing protein [Planctomycetaceae bacterium]